MATTAHASHTREPSITRLECDINPNFSFPVQPHNRSQSLLPPSNFGFPPSNSSIHSFAYPPRRGSVPPSSSGPLASASLNTTRPKSSSATTTLYSISQKSVSTEAAPVPSSTTSSEVNVARARGSATVYYSSGIRTGSRTIASGTTPTIVNASVASSSREGHQRVRSEMVGGPPLVTPKKEDGASVTATERVLARPIVPTPPSGVRRGHAHRRSGAISSGDVWSLMSQSAPSLPLACAGNQSASNGAAGVAAQPKGGAGTSPVLSKSAPVSPGFTGMLPFFDVRVLSGLTFNLDPSPLPSPSIPVEPLSEAGDRKSRVHFIDRVEIIPRPLSVDTEAGSTTAAVEHSANPSVASVVSVTPAPISALPPLLTSPTTDVPTAPGRRAHGRTRSNSQTLNLPTAALRATSDRPSTAGAILSSPVLKTATEEETFPNVPSLKRPATSSPPLDSTQNSPTKPPPQKKMHKKALSDYSPLVGSGSFKNDLDSTITGKVLLTSEEQSSRQTGKKKKGKKQIKNWAGTILGKGRGLRHSSKRQFKTMPRRSPTPPLPRPEHQMPGDNEWISAAWNENYVLMAVDDSLGPESSTESVVIAADAAESPIIDLDAALGPFKTPIGPNAGFAAARRRRMHSAVGLKVNGYFHRRSESMPEMQLFSLEEDEDDGHMDDVFEEEESEESESEDEEGKMNSGEGLGIGIKVVDEADGANWQEGVEMEWGSEDAGSERGVGKTFSEPESEETWRAHRASLSVTTTLKAPRSNSSMKSKSSTTTDVDEEITPVSPRKGVPADIITSSHSSGSTITGSSPFLCPQAPDSPSTFVTAASNPNTPVMMDFATDGFAGSATSFDLYSDFLGEPGPEMRMSVDDVPSLTSSSSTMTMSGAYSGMPSTPGVGSLGSLDLHVKEGKSKESKSKRWSRVFSFWKSK